MRSPGTALDVSADAEREADPEVTARLAQPDPADDGGVDIPVDEGQADRGCEHRDQQRQPALVEALGRAARRRERAGDDQGLHLHQERPVALQRRYDDGAGDAHHPVGEEQATGVGHPGEAGLSHLEQTEDLRRCSTAPVGGEKGARLLGQYR